MYKKNFILASAFVLIFSLLAFAYNIMMFYVLIIIGAFGSLGGSSNLFSIELMISLDPVMIVLALILIILSIVALAKIRKAETVKEIKKLIVSIIVFCFLCLILNTLFGVLLIMSYVGWFYLIFALVYIVILVLCFIGLKRNVSNQN